MSKHILAFYFIPIFIKLCCIMSTANRKFLFFSYGSNMSSLRISLLNIKTEYVSIGYLDNYRLDFIRYSKFWGGPQPTIVPTANGHVWGVIWRVDVKDRIALDNQEGVDIKKYYVKSMQINTPHKGTFTCRVYIQKVNPLPRGDNDDVPVERWPSRTLKNVIVRGAIEQNLPTHYINELKRLKDNGEVGCFKLACLLKLYTSNDPCRCSLPTNVTPKVLDLRKLRFRQLNWK